MLRWLSQQFRTYKRADRGATAMEYGLIASLVALALIGGAQSLSKRNQDNYKCLDNVMEDRFKDDGYGPCAPFEKAGR